MQTAGTDSSEPNYSSIRRPDAAERRANELRRGKHFYAAGFPEENSELPPEWTDRIVAGDCLDILPRLPDSCIDLVLTSPPYNFGLDYCDGDAEPWEDYFARLHEALDECVRVLKFGGRLAVNVQPLFSDCIPTHHMISSYLMGRGMIWKGEILWEKSNFNCGYTAWGSWKSPSSPYFKYTWEFLEVFCKGSLKKAGDSAAIDISAAEFKDWVYARWKIAPERGMKKFGHPAMFPEELALRTVKLLTYRGDAVLDPFAGAGTAALAAKRLGRRWLGIDLSEQYCETARARLAELGDAPRLEDLEVRR